MSKTNTSSRKRDRLYLSQEGKCKYCGKHLKSANEGTLDHVYPKSRGGRSFMINLVLCCQECNWLKGNFVSLEEAKEYTKKVIKLWKNIKIEERMKSKVKKL